MASPLARVARTEYRVRTFGTLWVMAFSFHYADSHPAYAVPAVLALVAIPCMLAPSGAAFAAFIVAATAAILLDLPAASNHLVLALAVQIVLIGGALAVLATRETADDQTEFSGRWLDTVAPAAGLTLLVVYGFAVFHKLNSSFFDPSVSCAGVLPSQGLRLLGLETVLTPHVIIANAWLTIGWESAVLLLLALRRFRRWGILLGLACHAALSLAMFYDFATFVFALYVLLLPGGCG